MISHFVLNRMGVKMDTIVAVDAKWGIGRDNDMLFSIPDDMKFFRATTLGAVVISGKNTLFSFPGAKPLPKRRNIIISRTLEENEGYEVVRDIDSLFELLRDVKDEKIFVIGGAEVYAELLPYCEKAYVTKMHKDFNGAKFFPNLDENADWSMIEEGEMKNYEGVDYQFTTYQNAKVKKMF